MKKHNSKNYGLVDLVWLSATIGVVLPVVAGPVIASMTFDPIFQSIFAGIMGGVSQSLRIRLVNVRTEGPNWKRGDTEQVLLSSLLTFGLTEIWHATKGVSSLGLELTGSIIAGQFSSDLLLPILRQLIGLPTKEKER